MQQNQLLPASLFCEDVLREERRSNAEHGTWPSINDVIDRMLDRELELRDLYFELHRELGAIHYGVWTFFDSVLGAAVIWNPKEISQQRAAKKRLSEINEKISQKANDLADLILERSELSNESAFSADTHYHICKVIEEAAEPEALYGSWLKQPMQRLRSQFSLKYWPSLTDVVRVLAVDASRAKVYATDEITSVATAANRPSKSDFLRALYASLSERRACENGSLPDNFNISDASMASLVNCLLDLSADELVDSTYIKGFRQRERQVNVADNSIVHSES